MKDKYGSWAIVTGASSGIGRDLARQLAAKGLNVVLVARRLTKLENLAEELRTSVEVKVIAADLNSEDGIQSVLDKTADLDVGVIANNAGIFSPGEFLEQSWEEIQQLLQVNVVAAVALTHAFAKRFKARGRGAILLTASTMGYQGVPYAANYAASKNYLNAFGEGLHHELAKYGVDVTVLNPGLTKTEIFEGKRFDPAGLPFPMQSSEAVAKAGVNSIGRNSVVIPGIANRVSTFMGKLLPRDFLVSQFGKVIQKSLTEPHNSAFAR